MRASYDSNQNQNPNKNNNVLKEHALIIYNT